MSTFTFDTFSAFSDNTFIFLTKYVFFASNRVFQVSSIAGCCSRALTVSQLLPDTPREPEGQHLNANRLVAHMNVNHSLGCEQRNMKGFYVSLVLR